MEPITIVSRGIVAGGFTGARPALTLLLLQLYARFFHQTEFPEGFGWIVHEYALVAVAAVAIAEHFVRTDPDFEEMMEIPNMIVGMMVSILLSIMVVAMGGELDQVQEITAQLRESSWVVAHAGLPDGLLGLKGLTILSSVLASMGLGWVRRRIMASLASVSLSERWYRWIETGTVIGAITAIALVPILAVALAGLVVVGGVVAGASIWLVQSRLDARARVACECGHMVRREAQICPKCGAEIEPQIKLGQPRSEAE